MLMGEKRLVFELGDGVLGNISPSLDTEEESAYLYVGLHRNLRRLRLLVLVTPDRCMTHREDVLLVMAVILAGVPKNHIQFHPLRM